MTIEEEGITKQELNDLRQRVLKGETPPAEEYAHIIASLRKNREAEQVRKKSKSTAQKKKQTSEEKQKKADQLLDMLGQEVEGNNA